MAYLLFVGLEGQEKKAMTAKASVTIVDSLIPVVGNGLV